MDDIPSDYAHKRGVWSMSRPSVAMIYIKGRPEYEAAMRKWRAAEPYALIAEQIAAPKPATPQPPEWEGPLVSDDMWRRFAERIEADVADLEKARQEVCGITDLMRGVSSPEGRAISDFTARRKAKRALANLSAEASEEVAEEERQDGRSAEPLSRAMSTPLPHDPDIRTRLMPWRNK